MRSFVLLLMSCTQDVSIMKVYDNQDTSDESQLNVDQEDTFEVVEPSYETQEYIGYGGYIEYSLRQVACPQCIGESQEINVFFYSEFYQPISDSQFNWITQWLLIYFLRNKCVLHHLSYDKLL